VVCVTNTIILLFFRPFNPTRCSTSVLSARSNRGRHRDRCLRAQSMNGVTASSVRA
jgi:hypothetical protein